MAHLFCYLTAQRSQADEGLSLDKEIVRLRRKIRNYDYQGKRLVRLFRYDEIAEDYVLDEINQLKKDRQADEEQLARLCETKEQLAKLANAEIKLNEFCARVRENLAQCTIQDKRLALDALDIEVTATPERIDIKDLVPIDFITIEQTWA